MTTFHPLREALVGGLAVCARATPRSTADVDIAVAVPDDATATARVDGLRSTGYRVRDRWCTIGPDASRPSAWSRPTTSRSICSSASTGVEDEIVSAAEPLEVQPGLTVPVSRTGHLIATKLC